MENIKTGEQLLDKFFSDINSDDNLDKDVVELLTTLFNTKKLTEKNILNGLNEIKVRKQ